MNQHLTDIERELQADRDKESQYSSKSASKPAAYEPQPRDQQSQSSQSSSQGFKQKYIGYQPEILDRMFAKMSERLEEKYKANGVGGR